jgi:hypothetical protein
MNQASSLKHFTNEYTCSQTCIKRGHLWEKVALSDRWPLKRGLIHMKFSDRARQGWPFNTGDCLRGDRIGMFDFNLQKNV